MKVTISSEKPIQKSDIIAVLDAIGRELSEIPFNRMELCFGDSSDTANIRITANGSIIAQNNECSSAAQFTPKQIANTLKNNETIRILFERFESLAGRPPKHTEQQTLMILAEEIGLPVEVTMLLVEYCFNIGKATPAYMKAVALDWVNNEITDIAKAEERVKKLISINNFENKLRKSFGLQSSFSRKQKQMIADWENLNVDYELIEEAYDVTITNTGDLSFPYMDKILRKWISDGIRTKEQYEREISKKRSLAATTASAEEPLTAKSINELIAEDEELGAVVSKHEALRNAPASLSEKEAVIFIIKNIGLAASVANKLIEYCISIGKDTPAYMKALAKDWVENGIETEEDAEARIKVLRSSASLEDKLRIKAGFAFEFSLKQKQMIADWQSLGADEALIFEAYDITVTNTGKMSFPYMNAVIKNWHESGIHNVSELAKAKKEGKAYKQGK